MTHPSGDLRSRLLDLGDPGPMPLDLFERVRSRARRTRTLRIAGATAGVAALAAIVVTVLVLPRLIAGPSGPGAAQLSTLIAAGNAPVKQYHGPGIPPELAKTTLWLLDDHYAAPEHHVIVSYAKDGHPCLGDIDWSVTPGTTMVGSGWEGGCSNASGIDTLSNYGPLGPPQLVGGEAYLYGTVGRNVRVVRADARSGHLEERFVATIATPADAVDRVFVFHAPGGTDHGLDVELTFFDLNGQRVGSRHVHTGFQADDEPPGCPTPPRPGENCAVATAVASPAPTR